VSAIKCYIGHSQASAGADQMASACSSWQNNIIPGISTIEKVAEDVETANLDISNSHKENNSVVSLLNSKGFGGNNATAVIISPEETMKLLENRYGKDSILLHKKSLEKTNKNIESYKTQSTNNDWNLIYEFGKNVKDKDDVKMTESYIQIQGYPKIDLPNNQFSKYK
jgi:acyl transferase domain-containing protein